MKKKPKILVIIILAIMVGIIINMFFLKDNNKPKKTIKTPQVVNEIKKYEYKLDDNEPKLYQNLFKQLQQELTKDEVDEQEYASLMAKMFIVDFYTLNNKLTKNDIGGIEFIYPDIVDNFKLKAKDTIYNYLESNIYGDRKQQLPVVNSVEVTNIKQEEYKYLTNKKDLKSYTAELEWTYEKDLGYETKATLNIIHYNNKLYIVEMD
jgi:UDP-GlcNAc:undecaprenyl-phosphate/decaprenyl-phosphate GlcNAc-1-phosphate transferase